MSSKEASVIAIAAAKAAHRSALRLVQSAYLTAVGPEEDEAARQVKAAKAAKAAEAMQKAAKEAAEREKAAGEEMVLKVVPRYEWLGRALFVGDYSSIFDLYCGKHAAIFFCALTALIASAISECVIERVACCRRASTSSTQSVITLRMVLT